MTQIVVKARSGVRRVRGVAGVTTRRVLSAAARTGGGLGLAGGALVGVMAAEARLARRTIGTPRSEPPPDPSGWYGRGRPGPAITLALLGDSSAAGYGAEGVEQTPGALIASGVAEQADRRVYLRSTAVVGARSSDLGAQVDRALPLEPDVAIILIGGNDVTHLVSPADSMKYLSRAVQRLRAAGVHVVVGTCPDLGTLRPIAPPLRQVARAWSRRLAASQTIAVIEEGGRTVSLGSILGPEFDAAPALLFGPDQFHPSVEGYRSLASVLLPSVLASLGYVQDVEAELEARRGERVMRLEEAAAAAVKHPGTELGSVEGEPPAEAAGLLGGLVELRFRRRRATAEPEVPEPEDAGPAPDPDTAGEPGGSRAADPAVDGSGAA